MMLNPPDATPDRICIVMPWHFSEGGGGAEVQAWILAEGLAERGREVHYLTLSHAGRGGAREARGGVTIHWLRRRSSFEIFCIPDFVRALEAIRPDVVVQRGASVLTALAAGYARRQGKRFIWVCSDDGLAQRRGLTLREWRRCARGRVPGLRRAARLIYAAFTDIAKNYGIRRAEVRFVQNGVQERSLSREFGLASLRLPSGQPRPSVEAPWRQRLEDKIVLWVGDPGARKRAELFFDLARGHRGSRLHFVAVGASEPSGPSPSVETMGRLRFEEALAWFDRAFVYVNTSLSGSEGLPNTFIQAWLRGVPVFTLGIDPDGLLRRFKLGVVLPGVKEMDMVLSSLSQKPLAYSRMVERIRDFTSSRFRPEAVVDEFLAGIDVNKAMSAKNGKNDEHGKR